MRLLSSLLLLSCGARTPLGSHEQRGVPACTDASDTWMIFEVNAPADAKLYAARSDGTSLHALPIPSLRAIYPAVSPDGKTLAYLATDASSKSRITLFDLEKLGSHTLVERGGRPAWSLDGTLLAYGDGYDVHVIGGDGMNDRVLVKGPSPQMTGYGNPSFATASRIVFDRGGGIESIGIDGSARQTLITEDGSSVIFPNPALSWDRKTLAAIVDCGGVTALRTWTLASLPAACSAGMLVTKVDLGGVNASSLAWSPDGQIVSVQRTTSHEATIGC
jgi:Tol biopolymer transport system component